MNVLVYEDNLFFATRLESRLTELGHRCILASTGERAIQHLAEGCPAVIVDLHAQDVTQVIAAATGRPTPVPVIAFCGHAEVELRKEAKAAGVDTLLPNSELLSGLDPILSRIERNTPPREEAGSS